MWNRVRMRHTGRHLEVWQNEVKTADVQIGGDEWREFVASSKFKTWDGFGANSAGHIGLQDHGDRVAFRNVKIRSLDTTP